MLAPGATNATAPTSTPGLTEREKMLSSGCLLALCLTLLQNLLPKLFHSKESRRDSPEFRSLSKNVLYSGHFLETSETFVCTAPPAEALRMLLNTRTPRSAKACVCWTKGLWQTCCKLVSVANVGISLMTLAEAAHVQIDRGIPAIPPCTAPHNRLYNHPTQLAPPGST